MPYDHQIWWEEPLSRVKYIAGVEGDVEVIWGQVGVNLLSKALRPPNLVGKTSDHSVMHLLGLRSCRGQVGSSRGKFLVYINKFAMSVCLSVCLCRYVLGRASTYRAETWHGCKVW